MKWVVIIKYEDGRKALIKCETFEEALIELHSLDMGFKNINLTHPVKVTIEKWSYGVGLIMKCEICIHYGVCQNDTYDNYSEYCAWYEEELPKIDILYIINVLYDYWEEYGQRYDYLDHLINRLVEKYVEVQETAVEKLKSFL